MKLKTMLLKISLIVAVLFNHTVFGATITEYEQHVGDLKTELLTIKQQFAGKADNAAFLELILNELTASTYQKFSKEGFDDKKDKLNDLFLNLNLKDNSVLNSWDLSDFIKHLQKARHDITDIKNTVHLNSNNTIFIELSLFQLGNIKYADLIKSDLKNKVEALETKLSQLGKSTNFASSAEISSKSSTATPTTTAISYLDEPKSTYSDLRTGPLIEEELKLLEEMEHDPTHFKDLKIVSGQKQKGVTCGSHAIINAWAIEKLLEEKKEISAGNIFAITARYFQTDSSRYTQTGVEYPIDRFIHSEEICGQIPKLIKNELEQTNFKKRVNFMGYHNVDLGTGTIRVEEVGLHLQEKFVEYTDAFLNLQNMTLMRQQYKEILSKAPHVEHFIYNTGGHWVLASIVQEPSQDAIIYFIDSMSNPAINKSYPIISRFVLSLYENFVKN